MRLCMMPFSIFMSRLGITDLVSKFKIYTNLIKLFLKFIIFFSSLKVPYNIVIIFGNTTKYIYNSSKKRWCEYARFTIIKKEKTGATESSNKTSCIHISLEKISEHKNSWKCEEFVLLVNKKFFNNLTLR